MTASLKIDPARCLELAAWAREVAQVRDEDVVAGADAEAKARTRENMAAIADQLVCAAHAAERWISALNRGLDDLQELVLVPTDGGEPGRGQTTAPRHSATQQGAATPGQGATAEGAVPGRPATSQSRMPPLSDPPARIPTTAEFSALQQPATVVQPRSVPNDGPAIDLVIADLQERAQHGEAKYGVKLARAMSSDAEDTADVARRIALNLSGHDRQIANVLLRTAELAVLRRLVAATLPGGLAEYWRLVEQELTS